MEGRDHPFRITRLTFYTGVIVYGKYIWQADDEQSWLLDRRTHSHTFDRARRGEY